uniref:Uncharacterized protein n=1 Tax=Arundo donax TaxID=35708 RepID=A0A0A8YLB8_ARUDO
MNYSYFEGDKIQCAQGSKKTPRIAYQMQLLFLVCLNTLQ